MPIGKPTQQRFSIQLRELCKPFSYSLSPQTPPADELVLEILECQSKNSDGPPHQGVPTRVRFTFIDHYEKSAGYRCYSYEAADNGGSGRFRVPKKIVLKLPELPADYEGASSAIEDVCSSIAAECHFLGRLKRIDRAARLLQHVLRTESGDSTFEFADYDSKRRQSPRLSMKWHGGERLIQVPYLVREFIPGITLRDWCNKRDSARIPSSADGWLRFARELLTSIAALHMERVTHGYISPDTIVVRSPPQDDKGCFDAPSDPRFINTEDAFPVSSVRSAFGTNRYSVRRQFDAPEKLFSLVDLRRDPEPEFAPTDMFSVGQVLLYLAAGRTISPFRSDHVVEGPNNISWSRVDDFDRRKTDDQIKNDVRSILDKSSLCPRSAGGTRRSDKDVRLRKYDFVLLATEVIMACLRSSPHNRAGDGKVALAVLDSHAPLEKDLRGKRLVRFTETISSFDREFNCVIADIGLAGNPAVELIRQDVIGALATLEALGADAKTKPPAHFVVRGARENLIAALVDSINFLPEGAECSAMTSATFWFDLNMGTWGRVATALQRAAIRKVSVKWVVLIDTLQISEPNTNQVLRAQKRIWHELPSTVTRSLGKGTSCYYDMRFLALRREEYKRILRDKLTGVCLIHKDQAVFIAPDYASEGGQMSALRYWPWQGLPGGRALEILASFKTNFDKSTSVKDFV